MSGQRRGRKPKYRANGEGRPYFDASKNLWYGKYWVTLDDGTRKPRKVSDRDHDECQRKLDEARESGAVTEFPTVAELAERWLLLGEEAERGEASTRSVRAPRVRGHIVNDPVIGRHRADQLEPEHIETWLRAKREAGYTRKGQHHDYSTDYLKTLRGDLHTIFNWAIRRTAANGRRRLAYNPVGVVEVPKGAESLKRSMTPDQAGAFVRECLTTKRRYGTYFLLCLLQGLRPGEGAGLAWDAIDHEAGEIHIRQALQRTVTGKPLRVGPVKTKQNRTLGADPVLLAALKREHTEQARLRLAAGPNWSTAWDGLVFLSENGNPPHRASMLRTLRSICADAEIEVPDFTCYEMRHSCASLLDHAGINPKDISDQLGHVDERMFYRHYRHRIDATSRAAVGVIAKFADG